MQEPPNSERDYESYSKLKFYLGDTTKVEEFEDFKLGYLNSIPLKHKRCFQKVAQAEPSPTFEVESEMEFLNVDDSDRPQKLQKLNHGIKQEDQDDELSFEIPPDPIVCNIREKVLMYILRPLTLSGFRRGDLVSIGESRNRLLQIKTCTDITLSTNTTKRSINKPTKRSREISKN